MDNQKAITREIAECTDCGATSSAPFCFPLSDQPIMLISAEPSMQAMYKPLYSIRFFRSLCLALFGDKCLREKEQAERIMPEFCEGSIYWTHYRKCYDADLHNFSEIDNCCADKYLAREISALAKNLKHIIVLGEEIHLKVEALTPISLKPLLLFKPFPTLENLEEFEDVRQILKPYLLYVNKKMVGFNSEPGMHGYASETVDLEGNAVHLKFELESFEKLLSGQKPLLDGSIEAVWHKSLTVPNMRRCALLVQTYSFIEGQIKTQISDYVSSTGNTTILTGLRNAGKAATMNDALSEIRESWLKTSFVDYVKMLAPNMLDEAKHMAVQLDMLRIYRNAIVHNGGLLNQRIPTWETGTLSGIYSFAGTVFVSEKGEIFLKELTQRVIELLCAVK